MTWAARPLDAAVWIDECPSGHGAGCDGASSSDVGEATHLLGDGDGGAVRRARPRRCTVDAGAMRLGDPVARRRQRREPGLTCQGGQADAAIGEQLDHQGGRRAHRCHRVADPTRLTRAGSPPGRWSSRTAANRAPISPTRQRPSSAPPASARSSCTAASSGHHRSSAAIDSSCPGNSRSANPNHVSASTPPSGCDGHAEHRRSGQLAGAEQSGDRPRRALPSCRRRPARIARSRPGRRVPDRRARPSPLAATPAIRHSRSRPSRAGWDTGSGAAAPVGNSPYTFSSSCRRGRGDHRAKRRSGGGGRPGSPRASRRRRRRARWRWRADPPSGSPARRPRPSTAARRAGTTS